MVVRGDQVEYLEGVRKIVASGNVVATYRQTRLNADQATVYMDTKDAYLKGRVSVTQPGGLIKGEDVLYNFETRKGTVLKAEGEAGPWRSLGDQAQKVAETAFVQRDGYLTSCDFEQPHTRFQAKEVHVFQDDRVLLKRVVMYVGNVPVMFLPSYTYLLNDKRPRVTLLPGQDKQWGLFLLTSWRLYLHENLQGRVHVDYRERLDLASGVDFKYQVPEMGRGIFRSYYTNQRSIQRKHLWTTLFQPDKVKPTVEKERFRVQVRHKWEIDERTQAILEYHKVKDRTLVKDFFIREFEQNQSPPTYLQVTRLTPWYGLTFLTTKRVNRFESVNQQLPQVNFDVRPILVPWLQVFNPLARLKRVTEEQESLKIGQQKERFKQRSGTSEFGWYYQSSSDYAHFNRGDATEGTKNSVLRLNTLQSSSTRCGSSGGWTSGLSRPSARPCMPGER